MFKQLKLSALMAITLVSGAAVAADPIILNVSSWKGGGAELAAMPELISKFEKENPTIKIKFDFMARNDSVKIISARLQGGDAPDVMMTDRELMKQWQKANLIMDMSADSWSADIAPTYKPDSQVNGATYMLPMEVVGLGMFVNTDLLKKAGVTSAPTTIGQYIAACAKLNAAGIKPLLMPAKEGWAPMVLAVNIGLTEGSVKSPNLAHDLITGKAKFSQEPAFHAAMNAIKVLADAKCFNPRMDSGVGAFSSALTEFQAGRVAMLPQGAWNIAKFRASKGLNFEFIPLPVLDNGKPSGLNMLGTAWAINAASKQIPAAKKWMAFWAKDENLKLFLQAEGGFSPLKNGSDGMPALAAKYSNVEKDGTFVLYPRGNWSGALFSEITQSMSSYFLDINQDPTALMTRWDDAAKNK